MIYPIYLYGHPVLRKIAEPVDTDNEPALTEIIDNMFATMYNSDGVGLAAPQVGISRQIIVIDGSVLADKYPECEDMKLTLINPRIEIIEDIDPVSRDEGCLSLPGLSEAVRRTEHLRMTWLDKDLKEHSREFTGFAARIIQHEFDHLLGKVYTDRISPIRKSLIRNKLNNIVKGKTHCQYRTVAAPKR